MSGKPSQTSPQFSSTLTQGQTPERSKYSFGFLVTGSPTLRENVVVRRGLLVKLAVLLCCAATIAVLAFLLPWGWLAEDNSRVRNVIEALGWVATVLGSSLALVIAAVWRWLRQPRSGNEPAVESVWTGRALHLRDGFPPRVTEIGLLDLGVKPAMDTDSDTDLPPFVARDEDESLEWALAQGGMVLLHGRAAAGKSRAGIEAIRRLCPNNFLIVPSDGPALREVAELGADFTDSVVWLDDLERFLTPGGLEQGLLHRLLLQGSRCAVVATMRDEELAHYDHASTANTSEASGVTRNAVELIEQLRNRQRIHLQERLSEGERTRAAELPDHRIQSALNAEEGFGEYLAAGRAMLGRWSTGGDDLFHVGQAIISAAVDCRRAGYHQPLPAETLETLYVEYLAPGWKHRADLPHTSDGIKWACRRVLGASSCLHPRAGNTFLAADYLLDSTETAATPLAGTAVPPPIWSAVLSLATHQEAFSVGLAARSANNDLVAEEAFRMAAEMGHAPAMLDLGLLLEGRDDESGAEAWQRKAAEANYTPAMFRLGDFLAKRNELAEAEDWLRKAAEAGLEPAMAYLGLLLDKRGEETEAEVWLRKAAEAGVKPAMSYLGNFLAERGDKAAAEAWLRKAAEAGFEPAMARFSMLFPERREVAEIWLRKAAEANYGPAMLRLGMLLDERGEEAEAEDWLRKAAEAGVKLAMGCLGLLLVEKGGAEAEGETWLRKAAEAKVSGAMGCLGDLLAERGDKAEAEAYYREDAEAGIGLAMFRLSQLLTERGAESEAETWLHNAAEAGFEPAIAYLADLAAERSDKADAETWQRRSAK